MDILTTIGWVFLGLMGYAVVGGGTAGLSVRSFPGQNWNGSEPPPALLGAVFWPVGLPIVLAIFVGRVVCGDIDCTKWFERKQDAGPAVTLSDRDYDSVLQSGGTPPKPNEEARLAAMRFMEKNK